VIPLLFILFPGSLPENRSLIVRLQVCKKKEKRIKAVRDWSVHCLIPCLKSYHRVSERFLKSIPHTTFLRWSLRMSLVWAFRSKLEPYHGVWRIARSTFKLPTVPCRSLGILSMRTILASVHGRVTKDLFVEQPYPPKSWSHLQKRPGHAMPDYAFAKSRR
jgi:hypothetical protein